MLSPGVCPQLTYPLPIGCRLDSEVVAMDSDGRCTVVACRDGSLRLLGSLEDGGFTQASWRFWCYGVNVSWHAKNVNF